MKTNSTTRRCSREETQVHRPLASGSAVAKQNMVLINEDGGYIIPKGGKTEELVRQAIRQAQQESPEDFNRSTPLRVEGLCVRHVDECNESG